jgi:hypothetical protein
MIKRPELKAGFYKNKFKQNDNQYSHYGRIELDGKVVECVVWVNDEDSYNEAGKLRPHITVKLNNRKYEDLERMTEDYQGENIVDHPHMRETDYSAKLDAMETALNTALDRLEYFELLEKERQEEAVEQVA